MTVSETVDMFTRKAVGAGFGVRRESSPVSDSVYLEVTAPTGAWQARIRISDHELPGRSRYPLEIQTNDTEGMIDSLVESLTK